MNLADKIVLKKPSEELLNLIKEIGNLGTKITELFETIKQKGQEEGFTNDEIRDLLKRVCQRNPLIDGKIPNT